MARPAIAVLPFVDATGDAGSSYLADGVADEITAALCAWRCFPVISRNTAFRYRGSDAPAPSIGRAIGARYLLTGAVQISGERIKVSVALIDAEDDHQVWSQRLVRPMAEVFRVEEEIAEQIVGMLAPEMQGAEMHRIVRKAPEDWTAWDLAMRAMWCANRAGDAEHDEAIRLAEAAAARAPDWYLPYALVAFVRFQRAMRSFSAADARTAFADTLEAARRALAIDQGSWLAHALTGVGELWTHGHHQRAVDHVNRALELNPSACWTYHFAGCIIGFSGDPPAARRLQARIFRIDPAYPYTAVIESDLGLWNLLEGDLDTAESHLDRAVQWDPAYGRALQRRVALGGLKGDRAMARQALARLAEIGIPLAREQILTSYPFRDPGHRERFFDGFRRAGINL
jgi:TolB-like protein/Tfp pilus assembly protein PilF